MSPYSIERFLREPVPKYISVFFLGLFLVCGKRTECSATTKFGENGVSGRSLTLNAPVEKHPQRDQDSGLQDVHDDTPVQWRIGEGLDKHVKLAISVTFEEAPLRDQLIKFSRHERIGLFVDRRVDSSQQISIRAVDKTFEQILWMIAEDKGLGVCRLGDLYYVGPKNVAPTLQVLWEQFEAEANEDRKGGVNWTEKSSVDWPLLSEPDLLLKGLGERQRFIVEPTKGIAKGTDETVLPHDVWPETKLPDLQLNQQIGLLVVGFGSWFEMSGRGIQLVPFPTIETGQLDWMVENPGRLVSRLKKEFPKNKIALKGKSILAMGSPEELAAIQKFIVFDRTVEAGKEKVFSLNTAASRGQILSSIAQQTGRKLVYSPDAKKSLNEQIKINVKDVNLDKLIKATLEGSELKFKLEKDRLLIE